jgi:hypothetical protein
MIPVVLVVPSWFLLGGLSVRGGSIFYFAPGKPPMDRQYSKFQQRAIKNFYDNREAISVQRLGELVTDLFLAEGKGRAAKWKQIAAALVRLGVPQAEIDHLMKKDDAALLAKKVAELTGK